MKLTLKLIPLLFLTFFLSCSSEDEETSLSPDDIALQDEEITHSSAELGDNIKGSAIEIKILELVNEYRKSEGLTPLKAHNAIQTATDVHTVYMIQKGEISHDGFESRINDLRAEINVRSAGENVAAGQPTAESVVMSWINSEGHRKNIVGNFTHFHVSAIKNTNGRYYYTNIFVRL